MHPSVSTASLALDRGIADDRSARTARLHGRSKLRGPLLIIEPIEPTDGPDKLVFLACLPTCRKGLFRPIHIWIDMLAWTGAETSDAKDLESLQHQRTITMISVVSEATCWRLSCARGLDFQAVARLDPGHHLGQRLPLRLLRSPLRLRSFSTRSATMLSDVFLRRRGLDRMGVCVRPAGA